MSFQASEERDVRGGGRCRICGPAGLQVGSVRQDGGWRTGEVVVVGWVWVILGWRCWFARSCILKGVDCYILGLWVVGGAVFGRGIRVGLRIV